MKKVITKAVLAGMFMGAAVFSAAADARYVFYFIGDGMGMGHVNAAETYNRDVLKNENPMLMLTFPVASQVRTYSFNKPVTDSAAAGTALSTGHKTNNSMLGMSPDTLDVNSIARDFMDAGYSVGVASTVRGDDATPAAFYAHVPKRSMTEDIVADAVESGVSFFGAPVFRGIKNSKGEDSGWLDRMKNSGYNVVYDYSEYETLGPEAKKVLMLSSKPAGEQVGYTIDSIPGAMTCEQLTKACLSQMEKINSPEGFFMMVEGGNIDWAAHANDGGAVIKEVLNFQKAIDVAYKFYLQHPDETLIVVTADHDTGGMALGRYETRYPDLSIADFQKISKDRFSDMWRDELKSGRTVTWQEMETFLKENLGFWGGIELSEKETAELKKAFQATFVKKDGVTEKNLYNDFNSFTVKVFDIFNTHLGIGWTTGYHTGNFVPVYAVGEGSELFTRNLNNIEIPKLILEAAGLKK